MEKLLAHYAMRWWIARGFGFWSLPNLVFIRFACFVISSRSLTNR